MVNTLILIYVEAELSASETLYITHLSYYDQ